MSHFFVVVTSICIKSRWNYFEERQQQPHIHVIFIVVLEKRREEISGDGNILSEEVY